jgi:Holliday junction resolvase RusA-like endonuclease
MSATLFETAVIPHLKGKVDLEDHCKKIAFIVPAIPVAQPRQRHRIINANGKTFAQNYTPTKAPVNAFKAACQMAAQQAYQGPPLSGPLVASIVFVMPRTEGKPSWLKKDSPWFSAWKSGERVPHAGSKNDRDNLMKSVQDALNKLLFVDDGMIYAGPVEKWLAAHNEQPHVEITITNS